MFYIIGWGWVHSIRYNYRPKCKFIDYQCLIDDCIMYPFIYMYVLTNKLYWVVSTVYSFFKTILESWTKENFGSFTKSAVILKQKHLIVQFKVPNQARTILYNVRINLTYSNISKFKKKIVEVMYHSFWDTLCYWQFAKRVTYSF